MQLSIDKREDNKEFSDWLLKVIKQEIMSNVNPRKLKYYEDYIKESNVFNMSEKALNNLNVVNVLYRFIRTLRKDTFRHTYIYSFNTHIKYEETTYYDICKLINYGNSEIRGYPFIINVFSNIQNNIKEYEHIYKIMYEV
jgi:hypothetical protein